MDEEKENEMEYEESKKEGEKDWACEHAVDILIKAEEIKKDAAMMEKIRPMLEKKMVSVKGAIKSLDQLKKLALSKGK